MHVVGKIRTQLWTPTGWRRRNTACTKAYEDKGEDHLRDEEREWELELIVIEDGLVEQRDCDGHDPVRCRNHQSITPIIRVSTITFLEKSS